MTPSAVTVVAVSPPVQETDNSVEQSSMVATYAIELSPLSKTPSGRMSKPTSARVARESQSAQHASSPSVVPIRHRVRERAVTVFCPSPTAIHSLSE
jgi:hypothetical protein